MTKQIRVENADTSDHKVIVEVWRKNSDGSPDEKINEFRLDYPTSMINEYIHDAQYLIIREAP